MLGWKDVLERLGRDQPLRCIRRASGEGGERIAQRLCSRPVMRVASVQMDELAELVDVFDRVLQSRLPAGQQRDDEKNPCETGEHYLAGTASVRR
jgi:hypothetical protein